MTDPAVTGDTPQAAPPLQQAPSQKVPLALMRAVVTVLALAALVQPVLAGLFLDSAGELRAVHGMVASLIELLAFVQIVIAVVLWRPGRGPGWPVSASLGVFVAVFAQAAFGYASVLAVHVPLGTVFFATMLVLLIWVWRPRRSEGIEPE